MNRDKRKNRKFINGTAAYFQRKRTQHYQREAAKTGTFHPRSLARSIGREIGCAALQISPSIAARNFRKIAEQAIKVPYHGKPPRRGMKRILKKAGA